MDIKVINAQTGEDKVYTHDKIAQFLYDNLDEYGDKKEYILKCIDYAFNRGGYVLLALENEEIVGAVIINETGMGGYIPENILVYIAVRGDQRGKGVGKQLMQKSQELCEGDIALHVEPDNPARHLYEKVGFTNKYLEMRWKQPSAEDS